MESARRADCKPASRVLLEERAKELGTLGPVFGPTFLCVGPEYGSQGVQLFGRCTPRALGVINQRERSRSEKRFWRNNILKKDKEKRGKGDYDRWTGWTPLSEEHNIIVES